MKEAIEWRNEFIFTVDLSQLGFSDEAERVLEKLIADMKASEEYVAKGGIDVGRFIMLTLNSTNHYYHITGVQTKYEKFRTSFLFDRSLAAIVESGVAKGNRVIEIASGGSLKQIAFIAHEGRGLLKDGSFKPTEFEVFDFMVNGQLRFAIYDSSGNLKTSGNPALTEAGKPSKCLWCHEIVIQPPFFNKTDILGYYSTNQFARIVSDKMKIVELYRQKLSTDINYRNRQDHTFAELLYLSFMEPSAERLASEWGMTIEGVKSLLSDVATHAHTEFPFLGNELYYRNDVDDRAPYKHLRVADDARERSSFEPDYFKH